VLVPGNIIVKIKVGVYPCEPPLNGQFYKGQNSGQLKWVTAVLFHSLWSKTCWSLCLRHVIKVVIYVGMEYIICFTWVCSCITHKHAPDRHIPFRLKCSILYIRITSYANKCLIRLTTVDIVIETFWLCNKISWSVCPNYVFEVALLLTNMHPTGESLSDKNEPTYLSKSQALLTKVW